jgi:hypothetical protein
MAIVFVNLFYITIGNGHGVVGFGFFDEVLNFKEENIQERFLMVDKHKFFSESVGIIIFMCIIILIIIIRTEKRPLAGLERA